MILRFAEVVRFERWRLGFVAEACGTYRQEVSHGPRASRKPRESGGGF